MHTVENPGRGVPKIFEKILGLNFRFLPVNFLGRSDLFGISPKTKFVFYKKRSSFKDIFPTPRGIMDSESSIVPLRIITFSYLTTPLTSYLFYKTYQLHSLLLVVSVTRVSKRSAALQNNVQMTLKQRLKLNYV